MLEALTIGSIAFLLSVILGKPIISMLIKYNILKKVSDEIAENHSGKTGTPTMGGLQILLTVLIITGIFNLENRLSILLPFFAIFSCLIIGFIDDLRTTTSNANDGLSWKIKMFVLIMLSLSIAIILHFQLEVQSINVPILGQISLNYYYLPIAMLVVFLTTISVAITDGLDGLLAGNAAIAFAAFAIIAYVQEQFYLAIFSFTMVGAILGFLWYNAYPAKVFMGETGALPIGVTLAIVSLMTGHWLLLPIIGIVFLLEAGSAVLQVLYFKITSGKRIFKMTPLHHHFEIVGWSENQIVIRFWLIGLIGAIVGIALATTV
ncbi:MAG: phospho-N-acetylmuramoyl-pentapeptide-transferase [Chloroflexi bacterium]|nr:phospho-N-acetylmuramoyl-pentapeptide-transferase [Chloroflexota bacterium]|tara:strand:- start:23723 stop:24682 length:960 start_codon:yes stop_codon:yes gene_type:complete